MSLDQPKFGDVFEFKNETERALVMYVAPAMRRGERTWLGLSVFTDSKLFSRVGEIAERVPLNDLGLRRWKWLPDD